MENNQTHRNFSKPSSPERVWVKPISRIPRWARNKYFLSTLVFCGWMLFFDRNDLFTQHHRNQEYQQLTESRQYYIDKIAIEKSELEKLKFNPYTLEKYAREKYFMKRENEDLYIIEEPAN